MPKKGWKKPGGVSDKVLSVRLHQDLYEQLTEAAERNTRTVTGEINHRLKQSFAKESSYGGQTTQN